MDVHLLDKGENERSLRYKMDFGHQKFYIFEVIEVWFVSKLTASRVLKVVTTDELMVEKLNASRRTVHWWYEEKRIHIMTNGKLFFRVGEEVGVWEPKSDTEEARVLLTQNLTQVEREILGILESTP